MLGGLDLAPGGDIAFDAGVGNRAVVLASDAVNLRRRRLDQPIADVELGIGAEAIELALGGARAPGVTFGLERRQRFGARNVTEPPPAFLAFVVLEVEQLPAILAFEELHVFAPPGR